MTNDEKQKKLAELRKQLDEARKAQDAELSKDWMKYTTDIITRLFTEFSSVKSYLDRVADRVTKQGFVMSPLGHRRILYRAFSGIESYKASAQRRAKNAPIQGLASQVGVTAAYLTLKHLDRYYRTFGLNASGDNFYQYQRVVHDANYGWSRYEHCIPVLLISLWCATYGVTEYYRDTYDFEFIIEPEIEADIGVFGDSCHTWDYKLIDYTDKDGKMEPGLLSLYEIALKDAVTAGHLKEDQVRETLALIAEPLIDKEKRNYLLENYPVLGLHPSTKEGQRVKERIFQMLRDKGFRPRK